MTIDLDRFDVAPMNQGIWFVRCRRCHKSERTPRAAHVAQWQAKHRCPADVIARDQLDTARRIWQMLPKDAESVIAARCRVLETRGAA